jgi:hypothetical protein
MMGFKIIKKDIWEFYDGGSTIVVTTNGSICKDDRAVMGKGIAKEVKSRYPVFPYLLGNRLKEYGNHVFYFVDYDIITFPVKHEWHQQADIELINRSGQELMFLFTMLEFKRGEVYSVLPGCGNGSLGWEAVSVSLDCVIDPNRVKFVSNV